MPDSKRRRRAKKRGPAATRQQREPDLFDEIRAVLADPDPVQLLTYVSTLLAALDPRGDDPLGPPDGDRPTVDELAAMFLGMTTPETTALLTAIAALVGDEVLAARLRRELGSRPPVAPGWLAGLADTEIYRAVRVGHILGDEDNIMIGVRIAGRHEATVMTYIDHHLGTIVTDSFVVSEPVAAMIDYHAEIGEDSDLIWEELSRADARAWIEPGAELAAMTFPPLETDSWPACRPLLEWILRQLPTGGSGYQRPQWGPESREQLAVRFFASRWGAPLDNAEYRDLLELLLCYGADYGPGDPRRWSATRVQFLLEDWLPHKVIAPASYLAKVPELLRAYIPFAHAEAGLRAELTDDAMAAVNACDAGTPELIDQRDLQDMVLGHFAQLVGGREHLDSLDGTPLPDEPFRWTGIPDDVTAQVSAILALTDRCCDELLDSEYRTVSRRLLARIAVGDPAVVRGRGRVKTAAAAIIWIAGKANGLFEQGAGPLHARATDITDHFGIGKNSAYQRAGSLLRAGGFHDDTYAVQLGSPEFLISSYRAVIVENRDQVLGVAPHGTE